MIYLEPDQLTAVYSTIARRITADKGQCVLILGPELSVDKAGRGYKEAFRDMLPAGSKSRYLESVNLFSFADPFDAECVRPQVMRFYDESGDQPLLEMISRLKFPLIINVCPDIALNKKYTERGDVVFHPGFFNKDSNADFENLPAPSKAEPVIYNIFGSVELEQSLILTHTKLYETIETLLPELSLPRRIELFLKGTANTYIFLGFKFDSWYYQLICHKLKIKTSMDNVKTSLSTPAFGETDNVSVIMNSSFDMKFTMENPFQCIQNIIAACEQIKPGDLRDKNYNGHFSVFLSYGRKDATNMERENIADLIETDFKPDGAELYQFFRDRRELQYGDSIDSFMTRIGNGKAVIVLLSHKYLTSPYCMREAVRILASKDTDQHLFAIVLQEPDKDIMADNGFYKDHWFDECQKLLKDRARLEKESYDELVAIYRGVDRFLDRLRPLVYLQLRYDEITRDAAGQPVLAADRVDEYKAFITRIKNKLKEH